MTELLTLTFAAKTATEAEQMARDWAAAEPGIRLERITRVRPAPDATPPGNPWHDKWSVEVAYRADDQQGLGL
jgi:hypothetical protein